MRIAAAQFHPIKGNINDNLARHLSLLKVAVHEGADLVIFPELSLTGYEPALAAELAISVDAPCIAELQKAADEHRIAIICGAPLLNASRPLISSLVLHPGQRPLVYSKVHLHHGEGEHFTAGHKHCVFSLGNLRAGVAICEDARHEHHAAQQKTAGADFYLASSTITAEGYEHDTSQLQRWARRYEMAVAMANFHGESGGLHAVGGSSIWSRKGKLLACAPEDRDALAFAEISANSSRGWTRVIPRD